MATLKFYLSLNCSKIHLYLLGFINERTERPSLLFLVAGAADKSLLAEAVVEINTQIRR